MIDFKIENARKTVNELPPLHNLSSSQIAVIKDILVGYTGAPTETYGTSRVRSVFALIRTGWIQLNVNQWTLELTPEARNTIEDL